MEEHVHNKKSRPDRPARPTTPTLGPFFRGQPVRLPNRPPWRVMSSRELAAVLGVHLNTLANWRVREIGPNPEPFGKYRGNRTYYRIDEIVAWLTGRPRWRVSADFIARHFGVSPQTESETDAVVRQIDELGIFPR